MGVKWRDGGTGVGEVLVGLFLFHCVERTRRGWGLCTQVFFSHGVGACSFWFWLHSLSGWWFGSVRFLVPEDTALKLFLDEMRGNPARPQPKVRRREGRCAAGVVMAVAVLLLLDLGGLLFSYYTARHCKETIIEV